MQTVVDVSADKVRARIISLFKVFPKLTISMLHPALSAYDRNWRAIFEQLVAEGTIVRDVEVVQDDDKTKTYTYFRLP